METHEESLKNRWKKNRTSMEELPMMEHIKTNRKSIKFIENQLKNGWKHLHENQESLKNQSKINRTSTEEKH